MSRDLWLTKRPAVHIDRIKKSLTIDSGSYNCGPTNASVIIGNTTSPIRISGAGTQPLILSATTVTVDFWYYAIPTIAAASWSIFELEELFGNGIKLTTTSGTLTVTITTTSAAYTITYPAQWYEWKRYTIAVDTANNLGRFYIDGVLVGSVAVAAGTFNTNAFDMWFGDSLFLGYANGNLQDVALYNVYKDATAVAATNTHRGTVGTYSNGLTYYWKLRGTQLPTVGAIDLAGTGGIGNIEYSTERFAPILYGASFVAAQYSITLGYRASLMFPNTPSDECNGMLVVRWIDPDDTVQRRRLWDMSGVDINPMPALYNGEALGTTFVLEWWNIDGEDTIEVPEDIELRISKTTNPTTGYDTTAISAATIAVDTTLAQEFPLTPFPLTFNSQQTYAI